MWKIQTIERRNTMLYTKPQILSVRKASTTIMGKKQTAIRDSSNGNAGSTVGAFVSDED